MIARIDEGRSYPTPEEFDRALEAFWRGSHQEIDRLVSKYSGEAEDDGPSIGALLSAFVEACGKGGRGELDRRGNEGSG